MKCSILFNISIIFVLCLVANVQNKLISAPEIELDSKDFNPFTNGLTDEKQQQRLAELKHIQRRSIRTTSAELLANSMSGNGFPWLTDIQNTIMLNYEITLIEEIFNDALLELFYEQPLADLSLKLWRVFLHYYYIPSSFETMIRSQLILYSFYESHRRIDYRYLLQTSYILSKLQSNLYVEYYNNLDVNLKERVTKVIDDLPLTLQHLFFKRTFCLKNKEYSELIRPNPMALAGDNEFYAFSYKKNQSDDQSLYEITMSDNDYDNGNISDVNLLLRIDYYHQILVKSKNSSSLVGSNGYMDPNENLWQIEMVGDDNLIFSLRNGSHLCATDSFYNPEKYGRAYRFNNVSDSMATKALKRCQWSAGLCA